jgi:hypothetical protein
MDLTDAAHAWRTDGFAILPGYLPADELHRCFPSAAGFHDGTDPRRDRFVGDEFAGIDSFPFASPRLCLLAVDERIVRLAEIFLGTADVRIYSAEAWAKYTGAADYDQTLHRDYLNHTVLVPSDAPRCRQLELFIYLVDVPEDLGPPHLVPSARTGDLPARPNWYPRRDVTDDDGGFVSTAGRPDLYDAEVSAAGPAGTVVAFELGTLHRGTALTRPRGARFTMHVSYRPAAVEWGNRLSWADRSHDPAWYRFVDRASPRQLELFGFPPPVLDAADTGRDGAALPRPGPVTLAARTLIPVPRPGPGPAARAGRPGGGRRAARPGCRASAG